MQFELYSLLATTILLISLATILFSLYSYVLFRVREGKKLRLQATHAHAAVAAAPEPAQPQPEPTAPPVTEPEPAPEPVLAMAAAVGGERVVVEKTKSNGSNGTRFFRPYNPAQ